MSTYDISSMVTFHRLLKMSFFMVFGTAKTMLDELSYKSGMKEQEEQREQLLLRNFDMGALHFCKSKSFGE